MGADRRAGCGPRPPCQHYCHAPARQAQATLSRPHINCGDNIIVINAAKVKITGNKREGKIFYWHTGHPGGIKQRSHGQILDGKYPERLIEKAVERMLPEGPMGRTVFGNLRVYPGPEHPHTAQTPEVLDVASMNPKNKR